jgi:hypothetical protein
MDLTHVHTHVPASARFSLPLFAEFEIALIIDTVNNQAGLCGTEGPCSNTGVCVLLGPRRGAEGGSVWREELLCECVRVYVILV